MRSLIKLVPRLRREMDGSAMIETSMALLLVFPMFVFAFEVCMFTYTQAVLGEAARAGVRYAIVHGTDSTACSGPSTGCGDSSGANVVSTVQNYAAQSMQAGGNGLAVTVSYPDASSAPPTRVNVTVKYTYSPFFASNGSGIALPMYATAEGRIVY